MSAEHIRRNNVFLCVSALVSTLVKGAGTGEGAREVAELCDKAAELFYPLEDYEEAARQEGWTARDGVFVHNGGTDAEDAESSGANPDAAHGWQDLCAEHGIEPYQWEVFEHWAVSEWLAEKLEAKGERIDRDFEGLCVWGRTTTGQSIEMDAVFQAIVADLDRDVAALSAA